MFIAEKNVHLLKSVGYPYIQPIRYYEDDDFAINKILHD